MSGLRQALEGQLALLPVMLHDNGYPVQAMPKATLLGLLALHKEAVPIHRDRVVEVLRDARDEHGGWYLQHGGASGLADALIAAGLVRDEAVVKASAIREAAAAQRSLASASKTRDGKFEHEAIADWLDQRADEMHITEPEGAHP